MRKKSKGFTLLELLVALSIMALIAVMAYGGLRTVLKTMQHVEHQANRMRQLQTALLFIVRDVQGFTQRSIRDEFGDRQQSLHSATHGSIVVEFTHAVRRDYLGYVSSNLQRVAYGMQGDELLRWSWPVLDRAQDSTPDKVIILEGVDRFELRYLDAHKDWHLQWPPLHDQQKQIDQIPIAIEITVEFKEMGKFRRLVMLPEQAINLTSSAQEIN